MQDNQQQQVKVFSLNLTRLPTPAKVLVTSIIFTMSIAMVGALAQIIIHDIIPTFGGEHTHGSAEGHHGSTPDHHGNNGQEQDSNDDNFFSGFETPKHPENKKPFYNEEQFLWALKWTHIHLFGMSMIFIFMGGVAFLLNFSEKIRILLIALPFVGIIIDISAVWLKTFISPVFFWLHIPGGNLFMMIFVIVSLRALWEMWIYRGN